MCETAKTYKQLKWVGTKFNKVYLYKASLEATLALA